MMNLKRLTMVAALALSLLFPFVVGDSTVTSLVVYTLLFCGAATAWNIFSGYTGYISLGHATYYGLGAYTMAIACKVWNVQGGYLPFLILPLAGVVAAIFAFPLGWIAVLRTRRHTFIVLTIAIFFIFQTLASNLPSITGGSAGMYLPLPAWDVVFFDVPFYYVALAIFVLVLLAAWWVRNSKYGLGLLAIRDDEDRALGLGVKTDRYKLAAYVLSAFFVGMVGGLLAYYAGFITPEASFSPSFDVVIALIAFLGGRGTILGPLVGGLLVVPLQQFLIMQYGTTPLELVIYGGILLAVILLLPEGIVPSLSKLWQWRTSDRHKHVIEEEFQPQIKVVPVYVVPEVSLEPIGVGVGAFQGMGIQSFSIVQRPSKNSSLFPLYSDEQEIFLNSFTGSLQRIKAQRLKPIPHSEANMAAQEERVNSSVVIMQEKEIDSPVVSWRCPRCRKPFLIKGNNCYCPRCGIIRPLITPQQ
jgi:branched-chain amino acid transport system permease protein